MSDYQCFNLEEQLQGNHSEKLKKEHRTSEIMVEVKFKETGKTHGLRASFDSGITTTILLQKCVEPGRISMYEGQPVQ